MGGGVAVGGSTTSAGGAGLIPIDRAIQNFSLPPGKDHFLYNNLYNRDVEFVKNLMRNTGGSGGGTGGELDRNANLHMQYSEFDHHRQLHDHHGNASQYPPGMEHQQQQFTCSTAPPPHMLPLVARSFSSMGDYPSETNIKHHCKSEKHDDETTSGKFQMHSNNNISTTGADIARSGVLVKTEFNEMQQSKSSPVHEAFEMTSNAFTSAVHDSSSQFHHDHHDGGGGGGGGGEGGSSPLSHLESTNTPSNLSHHHHHSQQQQCSPHSYESYLYTSGSGPGRMRMSPRQTPGPGTGSGSEISGTLFHCKSFFADNGSGNPGITAFYPNSQTHNQSSATGDDTTTCGYSGNRDPDDKVVKAIKARKMSD